ncbi:SAM-dependent methyltransferase, partial [Oryzihumus sp.]|uniref:SAM-dependent methyltransferase n=1 Tax=Oryzihumus sp. TaxID=1968903 RepID=UPI002EDAEFA5
GLYRQPAGPAGHFATSAQGAPGLGPVLAGALVRWMRSEGLTTFVDVGCGRGELLAHVHALDAAVRCVGVDVVPRPEDLPGPVEWVESPGGPDLPESLAGLTDALVLANEWLDVVPCPVAEVDDAGVLRVVLVDPDDGSERLGPALEGPDLLWCQRYWPVVGASPGDRVEVGRARDEAWAALLGRLGPGVAVAVDYGHVSGDRPAAGTLTGFRAGHHVVPVPDGSCDITAHVAMDSLPHDELLDQRTALRRLGVDGSARPGYELARADPTAYLRALGEASAAAALTARGWLGDFLWAVTRVRAEPA